MAGNEIAWYKSIKVNRPCLMGRRRKTSYMEDPEVAARKKKAAKKKATKKKAGRKKPAGKKGAELGNRIAKELSDLNKQIEKRLKPLRKEIEQAERRAGTKASRVIRETRKRLNDVELSGGVPFEKFLRAQRRDLSKALTEMSKAVRPARKKR